jgi:hypothetical protein
MQEIEPETWAKVPHTDNGKVFPLVTETAQEKEWDASFYRSLNTNE